MSDTSYSRPSRDGGEPPQHGHSGQSMSGLFRSWLRATLRGKAEASWRDTIEELIEEQGEAEPDVALHERALLANILHLRGLTAHDIMVPRVDIVALEVDTPLPEALQLIAKHSHSRLPVYRETLDDVVGMLHIKDVLAAVVGQTEAKLADMVREVSIVAPSVPVLDLLHEMRQGRRHMALVVDEFGGIDGLVTIEDLVEQIVGQIEDEHDTAEPPQLIDRPDGSIIADSRLSIEEFEARVGPVLTAEEREDIDTLGGLVFSMAGRIPTRGEVLRHPAGLEFEIIDADARRVRRVRVRRVGPAAGNGPAGG